MFRFIPSLETVLLVFLFGFFPAHCLLNAGEKMREEEKVAYGNGLRLRVWTGKDNSEDWSPDFYKKLDAAGEMCDSGELFLAENLLLSPPLKKFYRGRFTLCWNALFLVRENGRHVFYLVPKNFPLPCAFYLNGVEYFKGNCAAPIMIMLNLEKGFYSFVFVAAASVSGRKKGGNYSLLLKTPSSSKFIPLCRKDFFIPAEYGMPVKRNERQAAVGKKEISK